MRRHEISMKMGAVSAAALSLAPAIGAAAPVYVTDRPVTVSFEALGGSLGNTTVGWDIDGLNGADTQFGVGRRAYQPRTDSVGNVVQTIVGNLSFPGVYGSGPVVFGRGPARGWLVSVHESDTVSRSLITNLYTVAPPPVNGIVTFARLVTPPGGEPQTTLRYVQGTLSVYGSDFGRRLMPFGFDVDGQLHLGWARIRFDDAPDPKVVIERWAYESEPETAIHVDSIPAPPAALSGLTLLALGAAGMRQWRKQAKVTAAA